MKIAIIDLGTNTFNLLIAEITPKGVSFLFETKKAVKLGEGGINNAVILETPFNRGIQAMLEYKELIDSFSVDRVLPFATSAIRSASNGYDFVNTIKKKTGYSVTVIDGNREAELIYEGVKQAVEIGADNYLIMDIGGGSTEFIIANQDAIVWKKSYELGAARLLELFNPSEPILTDEIARVDKHLFDALPELRQAVTRYPVSGLIGSSGSFDSFAEVIMHKYHPSVEIKDLKTWDFNLEEFWETYHLFLRSSKEERKQIKGLVNMRVDMIVIASLLINHIMQSFTINRLKLSAYSLKEGVLKALMENKL